MKQISHNTHMITHPDVWMDQGAIDQLIQTSDVAQCKRAVGMPDLHQGRGIPIGAVFAFEREIRPALIGGDAGCGAMLISTTKTKRSGDRLIRRLDQLTKEEERMPLFEDVNHQELIEAIWHKGAQGLIGVNGVPHSLQLLAESQLDESCASLHPEEESGPLPPNAKYYIQQLGTAGGGNHFLEISRVVEMIQKEKANHLGFKQGSVAVLVHSGSRGLGGVIGDKWHHQILTTPEEQQRYRGDLIGAVRYAQANRFVLAWIALEALGSARPDRVGGGFDLVHNHVISDVISDVPLWIHRKGAAPALKGQPTVVLGSRGARSWVMEGRGHKDSLCSVAHGAGRRMGRSEALAKLKPRFKRDSLYRTKLGGHVICDQHDLLYEEHPRVYKSIETVIQSLEEEGAADRLFALEPMVTVKRV